MKKVLIITYYWPPSGGPGVQRFLKTSYYLREFGWESIILTVSNGSYQAVDNSLLNEIPDNLQIVKTFSAEPYSIYNFLRGHGGKKIEGHSGAVQPKKSFFSKLANFIRSNLFIPDARIGWYWFAVKAARRILEGQEIDAIITTGPPHSTHLIGLKLKKNTGIPWVVDLRDPWSDVFYNRFFNRMTWATKLDQRKEQNVFDAADALVVVSDGMRQDLSQRHKSVHTIYNGYDQRDFGQLSDTKKSEFFRLTYVGNFKFLQNRPLLWKMLGDKVQNDLTFKEFFRLEFVGNVNDQVLASLEENGLKDHLILHGYLEHKKAIEIMQNTTMLLFTTPNIPEVNKYVTGKIFEYMASNTPILTITKSGGNIEELLNKCGHQLFDFSKITEACEFLFGQLSQWVKTKSLDKVESNRYFENFSRKNQTSGYSKILNQLSENNNKFRSPLSD